MSISFLRLDTLRKQQDEIQEVIRLLKQEQKPSVDSKVGERFLNAMLIAVKEKQRKEIMKEKHFEIEKVKKVVKIPKAVIKIEKPIEIRKKYPLLISSEQTLATAVIEPENNKLKYKLIEPDVDKEVIDKVKDMIRRKFKKNKDILKDDKFLKKKVEKVFKRSKFKFNDINYDRVKYYLYRDLMHLGKVDPLMHDRNINEIICNGFNKNVNVVHNEVGKVETNISFKDKEELDGFLVDVADKAKGKISKENPIMNVIYHSFRIKATLGLDKVSSKFVMKREVVAL